MKKIASVILVLCMVFALSGTAVLAAGETRQTPFAVRSGPYLFVNFGQQYDWAVHANFVALAVSVGDTLCTAGADGNSGHLQASGVLTWLNEEKTLAVFALHGGHGATVEEFFNGSKTFEGKTFPQWVSEKPGSAITLRVDCAAIDGVIDYSCHYLPIYDSAAKVDYPVAIREGNTVTLLTGAAYGSDGKLEAVRPGWSDTITFSALCLPLGQCRYAASGIRRPFVERAEIRGFLHASCRSQRKDHRFLRRHQHCVRRKGLERVEGIVRRGILRSPA